MSSLYSHLLAATPGRGDWPVQGNCHDLTSFDANLILLHGRDDTIIPFTESVALTTAVGADQASLFLVNVLAHVDLRPDDLSDLLML